MRKWILYNRFTSCYYFRLMFAKACKASFSFTHSAVAQGQALLHDWWSVSQMVLGRKANSNSLFTLRLKSQQLLLSRTIPYWQRISLLTIPIAHLWLITRLSMTFAVKTSISSVQRMWIWIDWSPKSFRLLLPLCDLTVSIHCLFLNMIEGEKFLNYN